MINKLRKQNEAPSGVYILTEDGFCILPDYWRNYRDKTPVGIAVIEFRKKIIVALESSHKRLEWWQAAEYCEEYACGNIGEGKWYLPSIDELCFLQKYKREIDECLTICGEEPIHGDWLWSSTERKCYSAMALCWYDEDLCERHRYSRYYVRLISTFTT